MSLFNSFAALLKKICAIKIKQSDYRDDFLVFLRLIEKHPCTFNGFLLEVTNTFKIDGLNADSLACFVF